MRSENVYFDGNTLASEAGLIRPGRKTSTGSNLSARNFPALRPKDGFLVLSACWFCTTSSAWACSTWEFGTLGRDSGNSATYSVDKLMTATDTTSPERISFVFPMRYAPITGPKTMPNATTIIALPIATLLLSFRVQSATCQITRDHTYVNTLFTMRDPFTA